MTTSDLYLKDLAARLYRFQQKNILCDTVLIAEDNCMVCAHSVILAAVSPHIYSNFHSIPNPKAKRRFSMKLSGCSVACVKAVLRFLYTGSFVLPSGFQHSDQFGGILMVCDRMGIDVAKLNGVAVRFEDVPSLQASDLKVGEENVHGAAAYNICVHPEDALAACVERENNETTEIEETVCQVNLLSKEGESSILETTSVEMKTAEEEEDPHEMDSDKLDMIQFEQTTNCSDSRKMESSTDVEPSFLIIKRCAPPVATSPTYKTGNTIFRKLSLGSHGAHVSDLKGSRASAVRRNTSIRLATKLLQKIGMKKTRTVEGKDNVPLSCQVRGNKFTLKSGLRKHLGGGHVSDLACKICDKTFTSAQRLKTHEKLHEGDKQHACTTCGKKYRFLTSLIQHSHVHKEKRPYLCDICGGGFGLPSSLRRHKLAQHSTVRPFVCRECGRGFVSNYVLREHMESHTRPNICPLCGKSFTHRSNLNRHLRDHDGKKQHMCIVCGRAFNRKSNMEKHVLSHSRHSSILTRRRNEQQHACNECKRVFRSEKILTRHANLHSSDKSLSCELCAKRFTTVRRLQQHRIVHQEKWLKCNVCEKKFKSENFLSGHMKKFHSDVDSLPGD